MCSASRAQPSWAPPRGTPALLALEGWGARSAQPLQTEEYGGVRGCRTGGVNPVKTVTTGAKLPGSLRHDSRWGPVGMGLKHFLGVGGTQLSFPWSHPPPQFWEGLWAERREANRRTGRSGWGTVERQVPSDLETRLAGGTESNLKALPRLFWPLPYPK